MQYGTSDEQLGQEGYDGWDAAIAKFERLTARLCELGLEVTT